MKTLKRFVFLVTIALLLNACVVKSLHAFYTKDILYFEKILLGQWLGPNDSNWTVQSAKDVILNENKKNKVTDLNQDERKLYDDYNKGYVITYEKDSTKSTFLAMPFKIKQQLFLDFTPIEDKETEEADNNLYQMHRVDLHSLAKLDIFSKDSVSIKWLDSDKLAALLDAGRIKIKYETVGFGETTMLTASSQELVKFIEKYMASEDNDKWKTRTEADLKRL
ncbi:hypothetical protein V8G61_12415 [Gaetbulibacter sp. M240]|uniref:hypothetical protein n=1 Tax=Gaetbulibacter sp. M240 TaxID=3126511 RepID=UPI00374F8FB3